MGFLFEILFQLIPPKLAGFLIAAAFVAAGLYMWIAGGAERALYDAAVGKQSVTVQAEIRRKTKRAVNTDSYNDHDTGNSELPYLVLSYLEDGEYRSLDALVESDEYDAVKEGERIRVSFHPAHPEYVVTPMKTRPGVFWLRVGALILIALGGIFILMILASLAGD